ncbi:MAG TPA: response regulator [Planctomycetota bacterium]|nr:response regulator [Planctomycetota bacterium]
MAPIDHVVLIVEDDPDALLLLQRALAKARLKASMKIVMDGDQAVEYLSGKDPAATPLPCLVLLNLKLPKRSGLEVLEWMRSRPGLRRIPVIIISTSGEEQDRLRALQLGARDYHIKPIDSKRLYRLARRVATYLRLFCGRICEGVERDLKDLSLS